MLYAKTPQVSASLRHSSSLVPLKLSEPPIAEASLHEGIRHRG